jgi:methionine synthase II (cobalamin-independent)
MTIPTEPIGSTPRPLSLIEAVATGDGADPRLEPLYDEAIRDTIARFEATGSPVIADGEQRKYHNLWTDPVHGLPNTAPDGFELMAGNFYVGLAGEADRAHVLKRIRRHLRPGQRVFIGVTSPIDPRIETPEDVRDRVLEAAEFIPLGQLGTTDDCGFSPSCDDTTTNRDTAFAKFRARVAGTAMASASLGGG